MFKDVEKMEKCEKLLIKVKNSEKTDPIQRLKLLILCSKSLHFRLKRDVYILKRSLNCIHMFVILTSLAALPVQKLFAEQKRIMNKPLPLNAWRFTRFH